MLSNEPINDCITQLAIKYQFIIKLCSFGPMWFVVFWEEDILSLSYLRKTTFYTFVYKLYVKLCAVVVAFLITEQRINMNFVQENIKNIPAKPAFKLFHCFREQNISSLFPIRSSYKLFIAVDETGVPG